MKQDVTPRIEKLLNSLDQVKRVSAPPYFYTRLQTRMEADHSRPQNGFFLQPAFTLLVLLFLLVINVSLLFNQPTAPDQKWAEAEEQTQWRTEYALQESIPYQENPIEWAVVK